MTKPILMQAPAPIKTSRKHSCGRNMITLDYKTFTCPVCDQRTESRSSGIDQIAKAWGR